MKPSEGSSKPIFQKVRHVLTAGETLIGLALKYGVTVAEIRSINKLGAGAAVHVGQAISILTTRDIAFGQQQPDASASIAAAFAADGDDDEDDGYTAAVADLRIRFYLKVKQGPLLRYFNKGYEARWIYLVDQHILDFDDSSSSTPSRVYELKYPQAVVVRNGIDIQVTFTKSKWNHKTVRLFLRAASEEEAIEWHAVMDSISRKRIGTSSRDDRQISFEDYFANITLLGSPAEVDQLLTSYPESSKQYPLGYSFGLSASHQPGGGMRSSVIKGDLLMDNALDAVGDVYMVDPYSLDVVDVLLNSYKSANSADQRMQDDRMLALKAFWTDLPYWFDPAASERGRRVMCSRTDQVIIGCVSGALPIMMACPQTMMLLSCGSKETQLLSPTFKGMMHDAYGDGDSVTFQNSILLLVDATFAMMVDALLYMLSYCSSSNDKKYYFNDGHTLFGGHLSRGSAGWEKLVRIRAYFSIIRRRAMSLFGKHDRWEYEKYGLPLSQAYCTLMMSVFTTAILNSLGNCSAEDEKAALMTCRYVSHTLGFEISKHDYIWAHSCEIRRVAASSATHFFAKTPNTTTALQCLRQVHNTRTLFFQSKNGGFQFDYLIAQACGRLGVFVWMLFYHLIFSVFRVKRFVTATADGLGDNYAIENCTNIIIPQFCEFDKDICSAVCMRSDFFVQRKRYDRYNFNE